MAAVVFRLLLEGSGVTVGSVTRLFVVLGTIISDERVPGVVTESDESAGVDESAAEAMVTLSARMNILEGNMLDYRLRYISRVG